MDSQPAPLALSTALARPHRGGSIRVRCGAHEVVLEAVRGGHSLLWSDGRQARRFALGIDRTSALSLDLCAPRLLVHVAVRDVIALAPHSRLRGYVQVPLVPTIVLRSAGVPQALLELPVRELAAEWDDRSGTVFRTASPLHVRFPMRSDEPRAIVPVWLANPTAAVMCPGHLPIQLVDTELLGLRGSIVARPRRLRWNGEALVTSVVHRRAEVLG